MWPPKTKLIYDVTCPLSSEISSGLCICCCLLSLPSSSQALGKEMNKMFVISRLESVLGGRWCHVVTFLFCLFCFFGAIWAILKIRSCRVDKEDVGIVPVFLWDNWCHMKSPQLYRFGVVFLGTNSDAGYWLQTFMGNTVKVGVLSLLLVSLYASVLLWLSKMCGLYVTKNIQQINLSRQEHDLDAQSLPRALGWKELLVLEIMVRSHLPGRSLNIVL